MANPNGAVAGNAQNIPEAHVPRTRSTFPLHAHFFNTHRFGEYIPHYVDDLTKDDNYPVHSSGSVRTYTLKSPLMQNVKRNKDYFLVPMESILPLNWEKFFVNPVLGDDVSDDVGPSVAGFWKKVYSSVNSFRNAFWALDPINTTGEQWLQAFFRYLIIGEYFYSNGNLLSSLGCHGASYCSVSYDDYFDHCINCLISTSFTKFSNNVLWKDDPDTPLFTLLVDGFYYKVSLTGKKIPNYYPISLRHALQLMRDNLCFTIVSIDGNSGALAPGDLVQATGYQSQSPGVWYKPELVPTFFDYNVPCNLSRLWAYQLACAHYFTNDHIDYVYSAELYRQLIGSYLTGFSNYNAFFTRNGIKYQYDYLSAHSCSYVMTIPTLGQNASTILTHPSAGTFVFAFLGYLSALFGYRRSLRYLDYFTGSRSNPLAVVNNQAGSGQPWGVNTDVSVNNNLVSVIDITKSIQAQRFLNSVNRIGHQFEDYLKGIFGGKMPAPDYHNPFYLARTSDTIFGQETENTATEQMTDKIAITTNLRSNSGNYMFDCHSDRPGILIGITSYDIARIYTKSMDRSFLHLNRFDWFNPFMQYVGDQPIYLQELGINPNAGLASLKNFSYTLRHMEFKQKFNEAAGGFCNPSTDLDLWIFPAVDGRGSQDSINPDWIRSLNCEFDQFYVSLSGWSLGTYFHFIVDDFNSVNASRPMAYSPQILG